MRNANVMRPPRFYTLGILAPEANVGCSHAAGTSNKSTTETSSGTRNPACRIAFNARSNWSVSTMTSAPRVALALVTSSCLADFPERRARASGFGEYFISRAADMTRSRVCCGILSAARVLFRTAEIVPGVSPICSAIIRSVTRGCILVVSYIVVVSLSTIGFVEAERQIHR